MGRALSQRSFSVGSVGAAFDAELELELGVELVPLSELASSFAVL